VNNFHLYQQTPHVSCIIQEVSWLDLIVIPLYYPIIIHIKPSKSWVFQAFSRQEHGSFASGTDRQRRLSFASPHWRRLARLWAALDAVHRLNKALAALVLDGHRMVPLVICYMGMNQNPGT